MSNQLNNNKTGENTMNKNELNEEIKQNFINEYYKNRKKNSIIKWEEN